MSLLNIKKYPNPVLKKKAKEVKDFSLGLEKLTEDMTETMQKADGVGLAASQIGVSQKIIVVQTGAGPSVFFNPKILKKSGKKQIEEEGCLSLPGIFLKIKRAKDVEIEALNEKHAKIRFKAKGILARIFQHEIDHLDGLLIIDRVPFWKKWQIKKQIRTFASRRTLIK